ncbi:arylsulfatase [Neolewinella agarilytica]|nr:arylsulfatase [Neolewinella agarilytica]
MRSIPALLLALCLAACSTPPSSSSSSSSSDKASDQPMNIVLIMTDDQGYGDIAAHGNPWLNTPEMDALHDESVRFTNFHVATTCAPTRAGLMSGVNCNRAGAWHTIGGRSLLASRFTTLASELQSAGYATGIFGKWHLGDNYPFRPQDRGFDEVLIHGGGGVGQTPDAWGNDYFDDTYFHNGVPKKYEGYCTDVWFEEAGDFMKEKVEKGEPFFTYIVTNTPHGPYHIADKYVDPYRDNTEIPNPRFCGMIANVDDNIGRLRAQLRDLDIEDNTLIVFMTDNGTSSGANLGKDRHVTKGYNAGMRGRKVDEYEGGHRVPLFLRFPKGGPSPVAHDELTTYTDILPTLLDIVGHPLEVDYPLDGQSLLPLIQNGEQPELNDRIVVVDTQREELLEKGKRSCVMMQDWRLINGKELYKLKDDPGQRENLISTQPELAGKLNEAYEDWWRQVAIDSAMMSRIIVGHPAENPALITAHDWHTETGSPWNQNLVRAGQVHNGYWAIDVAEAGEYLINLYRWPPGVARQFAATVPSMPAVPGGDGYKEGVTINPQNAVLKVGEKVLKLEVAPGAEAISKVVYLLKGPQDLQTWITDEQGVTRGAYYVSLELLNSK